MARGGGGVLQGPSGRQHQGVLEPAHKTLYEASVREPMAELLGELSGEFGPGRITRPYRDVWFRADKSLYKTEIYATLERGGYVRFSADGLTAGLGYFMMTTAQLERYRHAHCSQPHPVGGFVPHSFDLAAQHGVLMTKNQQFGVLGHVAAHEHRGDFEYEPFDHVSQRHRHHPARLPAPATTPQQNPQVSGPTLYSSGTALAAGS
jgi:Conserved hypothetical protein (DUF2461)